MPTLEAGLKTHFEKYSFKNATLQDFVTELALAAKNCGKVKHEQEMINWAESWLKTPGCAKITYNYEIADGKISKFEVHQTPYNLKNIPGNRLREQKFAFQFLNEDMKEIAFVDHMTSDSQATTSVAELIGVAAPTAILVNASTHGYGKFVIDDNTLTAFQAGKLHKVEKSLNRSQIYRMIYDMVKSGDIPSSRAMDIITANLEFETAEDILSVVL